MFESKPLMVIACCAGASFCGYMLVMMFMNFH